MHPGLDPVAGKGVFDKNDAFIVVRKTAATEDEVLDFKLDFYFFTSPQADRPFAAYIKAQNTTGVSDRQGKRQCISI
jgi:hypothetical protein